MVLHSISVFAVIIIRDLVRDARGANSAWYREKCAVVKDECVDFTGYVDLMPLFRAEPLCSEPETRALCNYAGKSGEPSEDVILGCVLIVFGSIFSMVSLAVNRSRIRPSTRRACLSFEAAELSGRRSYP
ncbi:uncharacterized protein LOC100898827 [Galendromus occidentalis]|uniref:Uncharacterized protein LOC100898827 n=1 Tax=Galendromus occidentalis TaxID=34638 RepID=A0AAJ6QPZ8_9ACAR|nr:uncharacterized protein LOC100898827 [Galendromus occidentalis]